MDDPTTTGGRSTRLGRRQARRSSRRSSRASATAARSPPPTSSSASARRAPWWDWDDGKIALEHLFHRGEVVAVRRRRSDFARLYDLPERVLPAAALDAPDPDRGRRPRKELLTLAARASGVATLEDLADYHRQRTQACRPLVAELVEDGRLLPGRRSRGGRARRSSTATPRCRAPGRSSGAAQPVRLTGVEPRSQRAAVRLPLPHRDLHRRRRSGSTATTCCRTCSATAWSAASTSRPTAPPACCACRAPTPSPASTPSRGRQPAGRGAAR